MTTSWRTLVLFVLLTLVVSTEALAIQVEFRSTENPGVPERGLLFFDNSKIDILFGSPLNGVYVAFGVINNDGADHDDVWVTLELAPDCSPNCVAALDDSEDGLDQLGALADAASGTAFFFLDVTATVEGFTTSGTVKVWKDRPVWDGSAWVEATAGDLLTFFFHHVRRPRYDSSELEQGVGRVLRLRDTGPRLWSIPTCGRRHSEGGNHR